MDYIICCAQGGPGPGKGLSLVAGRPVVDRWVN